MRFLLLSKCASTGKAFSMSEEKSDKLSREERLAAKLRENLRRRKAQGREMRTETREETHDSGSQELPNSDNQS